MRILTVAALAFIMLSPQGSGKPKEWVIKSVGTTYANEATEPTKYQQAPEKDSIKRTDFREHEKYTETLDNPGDQKQTEIDIEREIGKYTGWLVIVGAIQFLALMLQVALYKSTLRHMRESSERQLQAYVFPEYASVLDGTMIVPAQPARANVPGVYMSIKNAGQTPAYKVVSWAQIAVMLVTAENTMLVVPPIPEEYANTLGPGGAFHKALWFDRQLAANEIADIATGVRAIYLYGRIEYRDAFGKSRFSNFRLRYAGQFPPVPNAVFNFSEKGNDAN